MKKHGDTELISKNSKAWYEELKARVEATTSSYFATNKFLQHIHYVLVTQNHQKIRSRCLVHEFSFTYIFPSAVSIMVTM